MSRVAVTIELLVVYTFESLVTKAYTKDSRFNSVKFLKALDYHY